ncbi:hypothetical protein KKF84_08865 [Myxococcota bacterium]|nr:hypothetical protein [Myxococcota bacterium]MBU1535420.1 hypothetical protein [Myxococcota bacterium]
MRISLSLLFLLGTLLSCEPEFTNGSITCDPRSTSQCPKGFICMENPNIPGDYRCYNSYTTYGYCGDGTVQDKFEDCDPQHEAETTCSAMGYNDPNGKDVTKVACLDNCRWDIEACEEFTRCGDGEIQKEFGETCDGNDVAQTCDSINPEYSMGFTSCRGDCTLDEGYCYERLDKKLDILFVADYGMMNPEIENYRMRLKSALPNMYASLQGNQMTKYDINWGVVSSSIFQNTVCPGDAASDGHLRGAQRCNLVEREFMVDRTPQLCNWENGMVMGQCVDVFCDPNACDSLDASNLQLAYDSLGCPRCINTTRIETSLEETLGCLLEPDEFSSEMCDVTQPLKAMELAVDNVINPGFVRDDALLVVVFLLANDDCSVEASDRFDQVLTQYPTSPQFACLRGGVTCDESWESLTPGTTKVFSNCVPRDDENRTMFDIGYFVEAMKLRKNGKNIVALSLGGDFDGEITVDVTSFEMSMENNQPEEVTQFVDYYISDGCQGAKPSTRIREFVREFSALDELSGTYSICNTYYPNALDNLTRSISRIYDGPMVPMEFSGPSGK